MEKIALNQIAEIKDDSGDYLVLVDYGTEGIKVASQHGSVASALSSALYGNSVRQAIVKVVRIEITEKEIAL